MLSEQHFSYGGYGNCGILLQRYERMFLMKYTVKRIDEDLDFGCEEHMEGAVMTMVACK